MEYYSVEKKTYSIIKFVGKWLEQEEKYYPELGNPDPE